MTIENITELREQMRLKAEQERADDKKKLPKILTTGQLLSRKTEAPKPIIHNLLHKGAKMQLAGPSKTFKTWCLIDLALSAGTGGKWMEQFICLESRVLYLNFEIMDYFLEQRVASVKEAKRLTDCDPVSWWPLRGYASDIEMLVDAVLEEIQSDDFDLVIVDPIYKALGGRSENDAGEMAEFLSHFDRLVHEINCSVVYSHHYAKGNALAKATMDRASGSGVLSRDPDQMVSLTPVELQSQVEELDDHEKTAILVETIVRDYPITEPFHVRFEYPVFRKLVLPEGVTTKTTNTVRVKASDIEDLLTEDGLSFADWVAKATAQLEISKSTFQRRLTILKSAGRVENREDRYYKIR